MNRRRYRSRSRTRSRNPNRAGYCLGRTEVEGSLRGPKELMIRLRYTAALTLVGWYLCVAPQTRIWWFGPERYDDAAPLSRWTIDRSFDKAGVCEAARQTTQQQAGEAGDRMNHAVCIASDDPRLRPY